MENALMQYLNRRLLLHDRKFISSDTQPGPVICISREVGCGGLNLARQLASELDKQSHLKKWNVLSKEILTESAKELDMDRNKLRSIMKEGDRSLFDDILTAFNEKRFKSDRKITKTLTELIKSFAQEGHCIIVGRAGHIIARDIEKSLLLKLTAPLEWRIKQIMEKNNFKMKEAIEFIEKTEKERDNFRHRISGEHAPNEEFDLVLNMARMNNEQIILLIKQTAQIKGLLETNKSKIEVF
ncbi:MAG: cytidylate kinase-like family protein [Prolixibacteraceae bacterium]